MDTYSAPSDTHSRCEVGIGAARHVYGPASVHLLPCKIHHTGPAPVATYFRPSPTNENRNSDTTAAAASATALADATGNNGVGEGAARKTSTAPGSGENAKPVAADGGGGGDGESAVGDQKWELFEDDSAEHTARFRGRKFVGRKVELPEGVHGVVLREKPCPPEVRENNEDVASYWAAETSFREVTVWGHDQPRRESTVDRSLAWLEVSKSIHDP
ncbi:unnamed protein product [Ectocarpus sp. 6 AP-2014]